MEYKTLRYPGHAGIMVAMRDLGLFETSPVTIAGVSVAPRDVALAVMAPRLTKAGGHDLVALRVVVTGTRADLPTTVHWELVDRYDAEHGVSAMMRTTGYSLAITSVMQVRGQVAGVGVQTPDEAMPALPYVAELARRGVNLTMHES